MDSKFSLKHIINNSITPVIKTYVNKNGLEIYSGSADDVFIYQPVDKLSTKTKLELPFKFFDPKLIYHHILSKLHRQ